MAPSLLDVKDTHPRRDFDGIGQLGLKTVGLAQAHKAELAKRLPDDLLTTLITDLTALGVVVPGAKQARIGVRVATEVRDAAAERTIKAVSAMRGAVRDAGAPADVQHAYGVGQTLDTRSRAVLKAVLGLIFARLAEHPEDVAAFGFTQEDIDALTVMRADLDTTSTTQQKKRSGAPDATKERNRTANRVLKAVKRIRGAGVLAFAANAEVRASFAALQLSPPQKPAKTAKAAKPAAPAKDKDKDKGNAATQPAKPAAPTPAQPAAPAAPTDTAAPTPATPVEPTPAKPADPTPAKPAEPTPAPTP